MKRQLLALALAGALVLSPALAAEAPAFSDVPPDAWYAGSVALCAQKGLLKGTGADTFSPGGAVTLAEVMTAAARLHDQSHGGTGSLPQAPEDWGTGAITTPGGAVLLSFDTCGADRDLTYHYDTQSPRRLHLYLTVTEAERRALTPAGGAASAVLVLNGEPVLSGSLAPAEDHPDRVELTAWPNTDYTRFNRQLASFLPAPAAGMWYRNALWYVREHGLLDSQPRETAFEDPASRLDLAEWICSALPPEALAPLSEVEALPDTADWAVLTLYRAGILTGTDAAGTFHGERGLTRAELAAVLARVAEPSLRLSTAPAGAAAADG